MISFPSGGSTKIKTQKTVLRLTFEASILTTLRSTLQAPAGSRFRSVLGIVAGGAFFVLIAGFTIGLIPPPTHVLADSSHIVSIYADGQKKVITSDSTTVGDALRESGIRVGQGDAVEPGLDTQLPSGFFNINIYRSRPVVVIDGGTHKTVTTASQSPRLIAQAAGLTVYDEDTYDIATISDVADVNTVGQEVTVHRAIPVVVQADGKQVIMRTQQKTVGGMLDERDVALGLQDTVTPGRDTPIVANMNIQINRVAVVVTTTTEAIGRETQTIKDPNLTAGQTQVRTEGSDGSRSVTYRIHYQNGAEQAREKLSESVTAQPVTKVVAVGTKPVDDGWSKLRACESGGNYASKSNKSYRGAYQFSYSTWASLGGSGDPADASPAEQDARAQTLYKRSGAGQWPICGKYLK